MGGKIDEAETTKWMSIVHHVLGGGKLDGERPPRQCGGQDAVKGSFFDEVKNLRLGGDSVWSHVTPRS
jgi:hypothetical protein